VQTHAVLPGWQGHRHRGGRVLTCARRVASDRDLGGSESRTSEEPCGLVLVRKRVGRDNTGRLSGRDKAWRWPRYTFVSRHTRPL